MAALKTMIAALSVEGGRVVVWLAAAANVAATLLLLGGRHGLEGDDVEVLCARYGLYRPVW
jgi:hypothetical protein